ncbi:MAG: dihydrofolate reductase family protein [Candidatus Dormibacteraeota bacterium]|nr:dihydrofolate reductase family protein [Candidatus Dormibacteraeota bacterium]
MSKGIAGITTSVDGYITGPDDRPGQGLGIGGERLHHWVFGGPWTYASARDMGTMSGEDRAFFEGMNANLGAGICGRGMYDAAGAWGGTNPFGAPAFVLTHRLGDAPQPSSGFRFVGDLETAVRLAREAAGDRDIGFMGGADLIRQALAGGLVDELSISTAPVILGRGKRLFDGFERDLDLQIAGVHASALATHVTYRVVRPQL